MAVRLVSWVGFILGMGAMPAQGAERILAGNPPVVHLSAGKTSVSKLLQEFTRQTSVPVTDRRTEGPSEITVAVENMPFWQAIERVADAAGGYVYAPGTNGLVILRSPSHLSSGLTSIDGWFRTTARRVVVSRDLLEDKSSLKVQLEVDWVPDLPLLYLEAQVQKVRLIAGGKPIPVSPEGSSLAPVDGRSSFPLEVRLPALPRSIARLDRLQGELTAVGASQMLTFSFDSLQELAKAGAKDREKVKQQVTCRIERVILARDRWTVRVTLEYPEGNRKLESYQSWVVYNQLTLVSLDGKRRFPSSSYVLESSGVDRAVISYNFTDKPGQMRGKASDWNLSYRTPARIIEVPVRFSLQNIPLP